MKFQQNYTNPNTMNTIIIAIISIWHFSSIYSLITLHFHSYTLWTQNPEFLFPLHRCGYEHFRPWSEPRHPWPLLSHTKTPTNSKLSSATLPTHGRLLALQNLPHPLPHRWPPILDSPKLLCFTIVLSPSHAFLVIISFSPHSEGQLQLGFDYYYFFNFWVF